MLKNKTLPELEADVEVRSSLDSLVQEGAQRMLQKALEFEVDELLERHQNAQDEQGWRLVVRNGKLPQRTVLTGAGALTVDQPRVRDRRSVSHSESVQFTSKILPPYLRRSKAMLDRRE